MDFMHPWIKMSVKREAEMGQTQAGRPAYNFQRQTDATIHRHLEKIRSVHEKVGEKRWKSQAGRPGRGRPAYKMLASNRSNHPPPSREDQEHP